MTAPQSGIFLNTWIQDCFTSGVYDPFLNPDFTGSNVLTDYGVNGWLAKFDTPIGHNIRWLNTQPIVGDFQLQNTFVILPGYVPDAQAWNSLGVYDASIVDVTKPGQQATDNVGQISEILFAETQAPTNEIWTQTVIGGIVDFRDNSPQVPTTDWTQLHVCLQRISGVITCFYAINAGAWVQFPTQTAFAGPVAVEAQSNQGVAHSCFVLQADSGFPYPIQKRFLPDGIESIFQTKLMVSTDSIIDSSTLIQYPMLYRAVVKSTPTADEDRIEFCRESKIMFAMKVGSEAFNPKDKLNPVIAEFDAYYDGNHDTIVVSKKPNYFSGLFSSIFDNSKYVFYFDQTVNKLTVYLDNTYHKGMSGNRSTVNNVRFGGPSAVIR